MGTERDICINIVATAYNAAPYLDTFFMCVRGQTFQGFRLVFVDDGSTDATREKATRLGRALGERFVLLAHETNQGLSAARNTGLAWAQDHPATYLSFLDCDDWFEPDYLEDLYVMAEAAQADLCIAGLVREDAASGQVLTTEMVHCPTLPIDDSSACRELAYLNPCSYAKLYRHAGIAHVRFQPMERSEDTCYLFEALPHMRRVAFTNQARYHYQRYRRPLAPGQAAQVGASMHDGFARLLPLFDHDPHAAYRQLFEVQVFIRSSIGGVLLRSRAGEDPAQLARDEAAWLDAAMPAWRTNPLLAPAPFDGATPTQRALGLCATLYKAGAFGLAAYAYNRMASALAKEVRF